MELVIKTPTARYDNGFTLIELMVAMVILAVVLTGVVQMFIQTGKYHTGQEMMVTTSQDLRAAKMLMVQEIREAGLNPTAVADVGFQLDGDDRFNTDANSIHLTRDQYKKVGGNWVDGSDGKTDGSDEDISYYRTNDACIPGAAVGALMVAGDNTPGCLRRNTGGGGQPVMPNVTNLQFVYYDDDDPPGVPDLSINPPSTLSDLDTIRTVEVTLTGQVVNPGRVAEAEQTLKFRILARNM